MTNVADWMYVYTLLNFTKTQLQTSRNFWYIPRINCMYRNIYVLSSLNVLLCSPSLTRTHALVTYAT